jgi:hypothetical protein
MLTRSVWKRLELWTSESLSMKSAHAYFLKSRPRDGKMPCVCWRRVLQGSSQAPEQHAQPEACLIRILCRPCGHRAAGTRCMLWHSLFFRRSSLQFRSRAGEERVDLNVLAFVALMLTDVVHLAPGRYPCLESAVRYQARGTQRVSGERVGVAVIFQPSQDGRAFEVEPGPTHEGTPHDVLRDRADEFIRNVERVWGAHRDQGEGRRAYKYSARLHNGHRKL